MLVLGNLTSATSLAPAAATCSRPSPQQSRLLPQLRSLGRNPWFLRVVALYLLLWSALQLMQPVAIRYLADALHLQEAWSKGLLIPFQISALLGIWIWNRLAARRSRLLALQIGGSAWILLCLLAILLPVMPISGVALAAANRGPLLLLLVSLMGLGISAAYLLPWSFLPDAIDVEANHRAGLITAFLVQIQKLGSALSVFVLGLLLSWSGYQASLGLAQPPQALLMIRLCMGLLPALMVGAGMWVMRDWERLCEQRPAQGAMVAEEPSRPLPMATTLPVALVQLQPGEDATSNRRAAEAWLERALDPPAGTPRPRLLMLPEIWNAPYAAERFADYAEPVPEPGSLLAEGASPSLAMVAQLARRHGVSVIAGSIPERSSDGRLYNTATVIDTGGRLRAKHRKVHLFDVDVPGGIRFRESDSLTGGDRLTVLDGAGDPLATGLAQPPNLGLLICYDIRFPELALLMQQQLGTAVIACPAAFNTTTGPRHLHLLMRARAVDTQCFLLACSTARPENGEGYPSYGHSLVVDPWGTVVAEAGSCEQVLHALLDLAQVALARGAIPTSQQRRHDLYRLSQV